MTEKIHELHGNEQVVACIVGAETYAFPVSFVQEIIQPLPVTPIPRSHPAIMGLTLVRGKVLPVIDLATVLKKERERDEKDGRFIIATIQDEDIIFYVHAVDGIQLANTIEEPGDLYREQSYVQGVIPHGEKIYLVLDFAKMIADLHKV